MVSKTVAALQWPVYRPRGWGTPVNSRPMARPWYGIDTERDAKSGEFICGWAVGEDVFRFESIMDFKPGTYWVWNIGYDIEGMLRDVATDDAWCARADAARFELGGMKAVYYHGKRFDLQTPDGRVTFIEASSFFGRVPLSMVGSKGGVDASKMSKRRYENDGDYRREVDEYCRQDARIVYENITNLEMGVRGIGVEMGGTPGATARRFLNRMGQYPQILWRTHHAFLQSYCGGRFEVVKRGVFDKVFQYDITSAYPWALTECPWLSEEADYRQTRRFSNNALYGTYLVGFKTDEYLGLAPRWHEGVRVYSKEQEKTWLTRPEVAWLQDNGYDFKIHRGVEIFDENATDLWKDVILELFAMKQARKGEPEGLGAKIVLNSMYGILIQLVRRPGKWVPLGTAKNPVDFTEKWELEEPPKIFEGGKYYAPVYASNLTALTRIKLLDAARDIGDSYIGGHTDSVLTTKAIPNLPTGLGGWELEKTADDAHICKTGMYSIGDKVKMRGITRQGTPEVLWQEKHHRRQRIGIKRAKSWDDVSLIIGKEVANNYSVEKKRAWERDLSRADINARRWIDSEALANV